MLGWVTGQRRPSQWTLTQVLRLALVSHCYAPLASLLHPACLLPSVAQDTSPAMLSADGYWKEARGRTVALPWHSRTNGASEVTGGLCYLCAIMASLAGLGPRTL